MNSLNNRVQLIGHVGADPEVKSSGTGTTVLKMDIATNRSFKAKSGDTEKETLWHRVTVFGKNAEICKQYVNKGKRIAVDGRLSYSSYTDKDGNKKYNTDIIANEVVFL